MRRPAQAVIVHGVVGGLLAGLVVVLWFLVADSLAVGAVHAPPVVSRGVINGLIGAAVVAAWFFILDLVRGTPFRTPAALASALLIGGAGPGDIVVTFGLVAAYTVVHIVAFAIAGVVFVALAEQAERAPAMSLLVVLTAILLDALIR